MQEPNSSTSPNDHVILKPGVSSPRIAVEIRGVGKHFGSGERQVMALQEVDWDVYAGQMSLIVGPSGCGKTIRSYR